MSAHSTTRALGAGLAAFLLAGTALSSATYLFARTSIRPLSLSADVAAVDVAAHSGDVAIMPVPAGASPSAVATIRWALTEPGVSASARSGRATLRTECSPWSVFGGCDANFAVMVPPTTEVRAQTTSGRITVAGMRGPIDARATSGDIVGRSLASAEVAVGTTSGDVELVFREAPTRVEVEVTSGSVRIVLPNDGVRYDVSARASSGDLINDIGSDPGSAARIVVTTRSGDIEITRGS